MCPLDNPKIFLAPFYPCSLNGWDGPFLNRRETLSLIMAINFVSIYHWNVNPRWLKHQKQVKLLPFLYPFHILLFHTIMHAHFICWDTFVYSCWYFLYVYIKCSYMCKWAYLSLRLISVRANISEWDATKYSPLHQPLQYIYRKSMTRYIDIAVKGDAIEWNVYY